ncbi:MAG: dihydropteroate synthase [Chitinophagaceae bacterium]|nr:dihydropteroate synthase [Chitinophagaceae bacterium]
MSIFSLNCKGKLLIVNKPMVMGIINCTPDSYFSDSRVDSLPDILAKAHQMVQDGAGILDLGGQSTRPGSKRIPASVEMERVVPAVRAVHVSYPDIIISVDTYYSSVAAAALEAGASIVNDVTGGSYDPEILEVAQQYRAPYVCTHLPGNLESITDAMQTNQVSAEVLRFFETKLDSLRKKGLNDIIIDPGFGFGKSVAQNYELLKSVAALKAIGAPLLIGISRKSMVYKPLNISSSEALSASSALHMYALERGVDILRVHDVKEATECITLYNLLQ